MRISRARLVNYRSVGEAELSHLGPFVVFYGPNGSGKSNLIRGIFAGVQIASEVLKNGLPAPLEPAWLGGLLGPTACRTGADHVRIEVDLVDAGFSLPAGLPAVTDLQASFHLHPRGTLWGMEVDKLVARFAGFAAWVDLAALLAPGGTLPVEWPGARHGDALTERQLADRARRALTTDLAAHLARGLTRLDDVRSLHHQRSSSVYASAEARSIPGLLERGQLEEAVARAATSGDDQLTEAFERLRQLITQPPLSLPDIEAVVPDGQYRLRVRASRDGKRQTLAADSLGLGEQQVLIVLASILFSGARAVAIDEPEAHLHAPTTGRALRATLCRLVDEHDIDQLFVATHSNLFDLDGSGFWSVSRGAHGTVATRETDLGRIDELHLFEPGAAKRVLQDVLKHGDPTTVIAYAEGGRAITAAEMLRGLQEDTEDAVRYARALSRATARMFAQRPHDLTHTE